MLWFVAVNTFFVTLNKGSIVNFSNCKPLLIGWIFEGQFAALCYTNEDLLIWCPYVFLVRLIYTSCQLLVAISERWWLLHWVLEWWLLHNLFNIEMVIPRQVLFLIYDWLKNIQTSRDLIDTVYILKILLIDGKLRRLNRYVKKC